MEYQPPNEQQESILEKGTPHYALGRPESVGAALVKLLLPLLAPILFFFVSVPTGFLLEGPGPAFDLQEGLSVEGAQTYPTQGELLLTAVTLQEAVLYNHISSLFDDEQDMLKVRDYLGGGLDEEAQELVDEVITYLSQDTAVVVGLEETGKEVEVDPLGALVVAVGEDYPAFGNIDAGEVIVAINGEPVEDAQEVGELIGPTTEGDSITVEVRAIDEEALEAVDDNGLEEHPDLAALLEEEVREVVLQPVFEPELGRSVIGVVNRDYFTYSSDVSVEWELERVQGPSAGLMMTLSLVNALTPDDLTAGEEIAGTGEINLDGKVGGIGGLPMKIRAAESEGVEVFIYPRANEDDLEGVSTGMELYAVDDLDEALRVLETLK